MQCVGRIAASALAVCETTCICTSEKQVLHSAVIATIIIVTFRIDILILALLLMLTAGLEHMYTHKYTYISNVCIHSCNVSFFT